MSLVGSLEDLGLGDILQIVQLSGKSGVLALRSESGDGQIVFERGLVRAATTRDLPQDLRELISRRAAVPAEALGEAAREARKQGVPLATWITQRGLIGSEALDELRAEAITDAVLQMFRWRTGEFSFEVREGATGDDELALATGLSPQFLALESAREDDEHTGANAEPEGELEAGSFDSATPSVAPAPSAPETAPFVAEAEILEATPMSADAEEEAAVALEEAICEEAGTFVQAAPAEPLPSRESQASVFSQPRAVIVVDPSLAVLEWTKAALTGHSRVHTFQHTELGIQRIRQYLLRHEIPLVLLGADTPPDPVSGARDVFDVAARLRRQAPRLPIVVLCSAGARPPTRRRSGAAPSAFAERPKDGALTDQRRSAERLEAATALRELIARVLEVSPSGTSSVPAAKLAPVPHVPEADISRLREASARLRARQGEVLPNVLAFAAQSFSRVALFMVREENIVGVAQIGLAKAGGPDDAALRDVHIGARESSWVRKVLDTREPVRGRPVDDGDHRLCVMLGNEIPSEAFLAPIESANRVVAILYADNLPGRALLADTGALEVVVHEAGLALDRALQERTQAAASDARASADAQPS